MMKKFTKDMLVPGKHVVELRNGERYFVCEFYEKIHMTNFKECFNTLSNFDEEMKYKKAVGCRIGSEDIMRVFVMKIPVAMGKYLLDDEYLTEIWHREEIFITPDEKAILRNIEGYEYIARTMDGNLYIYKIKPIKEADAYYEGCWHEFKMFNHLFQMVQWTDGEPWKTEDLLKLPEKEGDTK